MFDLSARRQINRGHGDGFNRAVELVVTPLLLGFVGNRLDAWLGTRPALTLTFVLLAVTGLFVKLWLGYDKEMRRHEAELRARRKAMPPGGSAGGEAPPEVAT